MRGENNSGRVEWGSLPHKCSQNRVRLRDSESEALRGHRCLPAAIGFRRCVVLRFALCSRCCCSAVVSACLPGCGLELACSRVSMATRSAAIASHSALWSPAALTRPIVRPSPDAETTLPHAEPSRYQRAKRRAEER